MVADAADYMIKASNPAGRRVVIVLTGVTLVCAVAWSIAAWMERRAGAGENRLRPDMPSVTAARPVPGGARRLDDLARRDVSWV